MRAGLPPAHASALTVLLDRMPLAEVNWALTGSTAFTLAGVPVAVPNDIDVQTDEHDWAEVERRLAEYVTQPARLRESERIRSYFGALAVRGVIIELMGGIQRRTPDGWTDPVDPRDHVRLVEWQGRAVPILDLAYEAEAYQALGRTERARALRDWLAAQAGR